MTPAANVDQAIDLFPVLTAQPAGTTFNPQLGFVQRWQATPSGRVSGTGMVSYICLDQTTGKPTINEIPAAQYNAGANVPPAPVPIGVNVPNVVVPPPIDMNKFNGLAALGEAIIATPFGDELVQTQAPPQNTTGTPLAQAQAIQSAAAALVTALGG